MVVADVTHSHTTFNLDQSEQRYFFRPLIGQWKQLATLEGLSAIEARIFIVLLIVNYSILTNLTNIIMFLELRLS